MNKNEKVIEKYPKAELTSCGDGKHKRGCYLYLKKDKIECSLEKVVLFDLNKAGEIVGIDFEVG